MTKLMGLATLSLLSLTAASSLAQSYTQQTGADTRSGFRDVTNTIIASINYKIGLDTNTGDADTYLNQINLNTSAGNWNSGLNLNIPTSTVDYHDNSNGTNKTYTLGTAISGNTHWDLSAATYQGGIDASVPDGIYKATLDFVGGASATAFGSLASFSITLQVAQKLNIDVATSVSPDTIAQGGTAQLSMTVTNNMTGLSFVSTSWYDSGFSNGTVSLNRDSFDGNWFGKTIAPGGNRTDLHSTYSASTDQVLGTYTTTNGVLGGFYDGDEYFVRSTTPTSLTVVRGVVPAPSASLVLLIGAVPGIGFLLRRRRN
ncbi:MAG: hypothetical protein H7308_03885 [Chthonomonadaceae bacterium]|nr:hypothetical protein [Chthonomonadaceae bacterium]